MALTGFHLRVAQLLGEATGNLGFGLGGGYGWKPQVSAHRSPAETTGSARSW